MAEKGEQQLNRILAPIEGLRKIARGEYYVIHDDPSKERAIVMVEFHPKKRATQITTIKLRRPRTKLGWKAIQ